VTTEQGGAVPVHAAPHPKQAHCISTAHYPIKDNLKSSTGSQHQGPATLSQVWSVLAFLAEVASLFLDYFVNGYSLILPFSSLRFNFHVLKYLSDPCQCSGGHQFIWPWEVKCRAKHNHKRNFQRLRSCLYG
jgi:hypothetical protein